MVVNARRFALLALALCFLIGSSQSAFPDNSGGIKTYSLPERVACRGSSYLQGCDGGFSAKLFDKLSRRMPAVLNFYPPAERLSDTGFSSDIIRDSRFNERYDEEPMSTLVVVDWGKTSPKSIIVRRRDTYSGKNIGCVAYNIHPRGCIYRASSNVGRFFYHFSLRQTYHLELTITTAQPAFQLHLAAK